LGERAKRKKRFASHPHYNQSLRNETHALNIKVDKLINQTVNERENRSSEPIIKRVVSTDHIKQYVEEMLKNTDINIYGFPDAIEKQIYRNVFRMLLNVLDHALETSEIRLFGHKIIFELQPIEHTLDTNADVDLQ